MKYFTPNAAKKEPGMIAGELQIPSERVTDENLFAPDKKARRMGEICATPEEVEKYKYDPNSARQNVRPGIPLDDYNETVLGD